MSLYDSTLDSLQMEGLNERLPNVDGIYAESVVNTISFISVVLPLKKLFNLSAKMQTLEKSNKTDDREIHTQTEELNGEPISVLHCKIREEQLRVSDDQP